MTAENYKRKWPSLAVDREVGQHGAVDDGIACVAVPVARLSREIVSAHEHWQMDASAPELYERYLVPAITSAWTNDLLDRVRPTRQESVLDIACGTGVVARLLEQPDRLIGSSVAGSTADPSELGGLVKMVFYAVGRSFRSPSY